MAEAIWHRPSRFCKRESTFWNLTFCTLCRYDALFGPGHKEGGGLHAAVPDEVFAALERESLGKLECFASPLLCQKTWHFCSIFKDLDVFFGSPGPIPGGRLGHRDCGRGL